MTADNGLCHISFNNDNGSDGNDDYVDAKPGWDYVSTDSFE